MRLNYLALLLLAAWAAISPVQTFAEPAVTFEVVATFDYPGAVATYPMKINDHGDVAGYFIHADGGHRGFVRAPDGRFSAPIDPGHDDNAFITGISNSGTVYGYISAAAGSIYYESFFLNGTSFISYQVNGASSTYVEGLNDAGDLCGALQTAYGSPISAFVDIGGTEADFRIQNATDTSARGINNLGQCVGYFYITTAHGFLREVDGTLVTPIDAPGALSTALYGINDRGWMVGTADDHEGGHGVFFQSLGNLARFDYPGGIGTGFTAINNHGLICGIYADSAHASHAFIAKVGLVTTE